MDEQIYPAVQGGFTDGNAYLRELTLKSMLVMAPKLSQRTLNQSLLKHLAKLQARLVFSRPAPGCSLLVEDACCCCPWMGGQCGWVVNVDGWQWSLLATWSPIQVSSPIHIILAGSVVVLVCWLLLQNHRQDKRHEVKRSSTTLGLQLHGRAFAVWLGCAEHCALF